MRSSLLRCCVPALFAAAPAFALPGNKPASEPEESAPRAEPPPSAAFVEAAMLRPQESTPPPAGTDAAAPPPPAEEEAAGPPPQAKSEKHATLHPFVFYESLELDTLTIDPDDDNTGGLPKVDISGIDQKRAGLGMAFGNRTVRGYFRFFGDQLGDSPNDFEGGGGGGGVMGVPRLTEINDDTHLILPYRLDLTLSFLENDSAAAGLPGDLLYMNGRAEVGIGIEWMGLQPSLGIQSTSSIGYLSDDITDANNTNDYLLTGFNPGFYAGVAYKHAEFPMFIDLRFYGGDVSGWTGVLGASF